MIYSIKIPANHCTCEECGHEWVSIGATPPTNCQKCRSRKWNGKRRIRGPQIALPAPRKGGRPKIITLIGDDV